MQLQQCAKHPLFAFITYFIIILLVIMILIQVFALLVIFRHKGGIRRNSNVINYA